VDECFPKTKSFVKKHPFDDQEDLCERIKAASHEVLKQDCEGWIKHCAPLFNKIIDIKTDL
ncbi:hypothetical protein BCV72DRAFT_213530, partial [Rhizopus microsporus var. microsporus]